MPPSEWENARIDEILMYQSAQTYQAAAVAEKNSTAAPENMTLSRMISALNSLSSLSDNIYWV